MGKKKKNMSWLEEDDDSTLDMEVFDANRVILNKWDTVVAIKDLKVKWMKDIKRGDKFTNIKLTDDPLVIESWKMVLKTEFFKKI